MESLSSLGSHGAGGNGPSGAGESDLRHYLRILKKRRYLIGAVTAVVLGLFMAYSLWKPRIYEATATVIIDPLAPKVLPMQSVVELGSGNFWDVSNYYNTQIRIIKSRWMAREVVLKNASLVRDPRVTYIERPAGAPPPTEEELTEAAISYVMAGIKVQPVRDSRIFGITFADRDPKLAAVLANAVTSSFIEQNRAVKVDATRDATRWVAKQLDDSRKDLDRSETALYTFKKENNILSVNLEERQNIISKSLDTFSTALTATRKQRIDLETRLKAIRGLMSVDAANAPASYVTQSDTISQLRSAYLEERRKLQFLTDKYGEKWPEVIAQKARTDQTLSDLRGEGERLVNSIVAEVGALEDAERRYGGEVKALTDEALDVNQKEIAYKRLTRDATNADQIYALLLKRLNESEIEEQDLTNNIRPLDEALVPIIPSEPRLRQSAVIGLAAGLVLALALAFFVEILDRSIKSQEDIEVGLGLPFLGMVPSVDQTEVRGARELYIIKHPNSSVAESCRVVRTNILFCSPDRPLRSLLVTSSNPLDGKTMTSVHLGVVMAQSGQRTLLVDTDMRRARLHRILGTSNEHGVSRLIVGEDDIDAAVKSTEVPNLFLLSCGPIPPNPAELLQTERFANLVKRLTEKFDRVIFDSPPVLAVTDAVILSRIVDGTVVVVRAGKTTREAMARTKSTLGAANPNLLGVILNDVDTKNPHYSGYYAYAGKYYGTSKAEEAKAGEG